MKTFLALALLLVSLGTLAGCSGRAQSQTQKPLATRQVSFEAANDVETKAVHLCKGITVAGKRCTRRVKNDGDYCFQHKIQANPCWRPKGSQPKEDCYYEDGDVTRPIPGKP